MPKARDFLRQVRRTEFLRLFLTILSKARNSLLSQTLRRQAVLISLVFLGIHQEESGKSDCRSLGNPESRIFSSSMGNGL